MMVEQARASLKTLLDTALRAMREAVVEFHKGVVFRVESPSQYPMEAREVSFLSDDFAIEEKDLENVSQAVYVDTLRALNKYRHISIVRLPIYGIGVISEHGQVGFCAATASVSHHHFKQPRYIFYVSYMFKDPNENV